MADGITFKLDDAVLQKIIANLPARIDDFMDKEAELVKNDVILSFGKGPAGRTYRRGKNVYHVASARPGPPAVDTGTLRGSIIWAPEETHGYTHQRLVSDGVEYGIYLEIGTPKMAARPFMGPAIKRREKAFAEDARREGLIK